jgi:hypothetical protein
MFVEKDKARFLVKMSLTPYMIPDMIMRREGDKTVIEFLGDTEKQVFDSVEDAEMFWKQNRQIGTQDMWCN